MPSTLPTVSLNSPNVEKQFRSHLDVAGFVVVEDAYKSDELKSLRDGIPALESVNSVRDRSSPARASDGIHGSTQPSAAPTA